MTQIHPFTELTPDTVLDAVDSMGYQTNGRLLALNSYENRVYQVGLEDEQPLIAKFYRPERWTDAQILEEHEFTLELAAREIPVVAPIQHGDQQTLLQFNRFRFALYPRRGGHAPDLYMPEQRDWMGRFIGRIHAVGKVKPFSQRIAFSIEEFGTEASRYLLESDFIPPEYQSSYQTVTNTLLAMIEERFRMAGDFETLRLHGDCHAGNVLWTDQGPHFVDFDDSRQGPAVQDLWMLLSGDRQEMAIQLADLIEAYEEFQEFNLKELHLIEALRALRMIHYAAWLARRWDDPAFPASFTWFNTIRYWESHLQELNEQLATIQEPTIQLPGQGQF
jgi:Ser/Thr protein kinase RdoA (MazF antagonist)